MKSLAYGAALFCLLLAVGLLAVGFLLWFLDPNQLKPLITQKVLSTTGRQLTLPGQLSWSFYPIGIHAEQMIITHPPETQTVLNLSDVTITTSLRSLFKAKESLRAQLTVKELNFKQVKAQHLQMTLEWKNSILRIQPLQADFYSGTITGEIEGGHFDSTPRWSANIKVQNMQMGNMLKDIVPKRDPILAGLANLQLDVVSAGANVAALLQQLSGNGMFTLTHGAMNGVDLNYVVESAEALVNKQTLHLPDNINQTVVNDLSATLSIRDGVVTTQNLLLQANAFSAKGEGNFDLPTQELAIQLDVTPEKSAQFQWKIPINLSGNLQKLQVNLQTKALEKELMKEKLDEIKEKAKHYIEKNLTNSDAFLSRLFA